jgi:hypothetical protein
MPVGSQAGIRQAFLKVVLEAFLKAVLQAFLKAVLQAFLKAVLQAFLKAVLQAFLKAVLQAFLKAVLQALLKAVLQAFLKAVLQASILVSCDTERGGGDEATAGGDAGIGPHVLREVRERRAREGRAGGGLRRGDALWRPQKACPQRHTVLSAQAPGCSRACPPALLLLMVCWEGPRGAGRMGWTLLCWEGPRGAAPQGREGCSFAVRCPGPKG